MKSGVTAYSWIIQAMPKGIKCTNCGQEPYQTKYEGKTSKEGSSGLPGNRSLLHTFDFQIVDEYLLTKKNILVFASKSVYKKDIPEYSQALIIEIN